MRRAGGTGLGLVLLLAATRAAPSAEIAHGPARFDLPGLFEGWTRKDVSDGLVSERVFEPTTPRERKGAAILIVARPKPASPRFADGFDAFVRSLKQVPADRKPLIARAGETLDGHRIRVEQRCCRATDGLRMNAWHVGIAAGASEHCLVLLTLQPERESETPLREAFEALLRTDRPSLADRGLVLAPTSGDGGLDGLYTRHRRAGADGSRTTGSTEPRSTRNSVS